MDRSHFEFCCFERADLRKGKFHNCNFDYADFDDVESLTETLFSNSDFSSSKKLKFDSTTQVENKCLISENVYKNNLSFFKNLSLNTDFRIETQSNIEFPFEFRQLIL